MVCPDATFAKIRIVAVARKDRLLFWHDCDLGGSWVSLGVKAPDSSLALRFRDLEGQDSQL